MFGIWFLMLKCSCLDRLVLRLLWNNFILNQHVKITKEHCSFILHREHFESASLEFIFVSSFPRIYLIYLFMMLFNIFQCFDFLQIISSINIFKDFSWWCFLLFTINKFMSYIKLLTTSSQLNI